MMRFILNRTPNVPAFHAGSIGYSGWLLSAAVFIAALCGFAPAPARAAVHTYFMTGEVDPFRFPSFQTMPVGTQFAGTYTFDDAASDSNGSSDIGQYDGNGSFFMNFGPSLGTITFDQNPTTLVRNDQPGFGGFFTEDSFGIVATEGSRDTTAALPNSTLSLPAFRFLISAFGSPTTLMGDSLAAVPQVVGPPTWDDHDQIVNLEFSDTPNSACGGLISHCVVVFEVRTVDVAYNLTVIKTGNGAASGLVLSEPFGIFCGSDCSAIMGGTVVLTASSPTGRSRLVGFSGCDSVSGDECTVTLASDRTVIAEFETVYIPTLSTPGLIVLGAFLLAFGLVGLIVRRRQTA